MGRKIGSKTFGFLIKILLILNLLAIATLTYQTAMEDRWTNCKIDYMSP